MASRSRGHVRPDPSRCRRLVTNNGLDRFDDRVFDKRRRSRQQLVQDRAQRINVALFGRRLLQGLLSRHVSGRSNERAGLSLPVVFV